jgi:hypothetical protein
MLLEYSFARAKSKLDCAVRVDQQGRNALAKLVVASGLRERSRGLVDHGRALTHGVA